MHEIITYDEALENHSGLSLTTTRTLWLSTRDSKRGLTWFRNLYVISTYEILTSSVNLHG